MGFLELVPIAVGLSMDAFAVSVCKGLSVERAGLRHALTAGLYFGGFQALMPVIGYLIGSEFAELIKSFDHWVAFALLALIGINMIRESFDKDEDKQNDSFSFKTMLPLAVATSIDAMAVGVSFAFHEVRIAGAAVIIGVTTLILSAAGIFIGNAFGAKYKSKAELAGGVILILIGLKVLLQDLGVL